jgi:hypothetical protein
LKTNLSAIFGAVLGLALSAATSAAQSPISQAEILYLLAFVERSGCQFYRNGNWYDSKTAQAHLRDKYKFLAARNQINTAEDFIAKVASTSSLTGQPYRVRCGNGMEARTDQWLANELTRYRAGGAPAAPRTSRGAAGMSLPDS